MFYYPLSIIIFTPETIISKAVPFAQEFPFHQRQIKKANHEDRKTSCKRQEVVTPHFLWCYKKKKKHCKNNPVFRAFPLCTKFYSAPIQFWVYDTVFACFLFIFTLGLKRNLLLLLCEFKNVSLALKKKKKNFNLIKKYKKPHPWL